jgi:hypothetical protein
MSYAPTIRYSDVVVRVVPSRPVYTDPTSAERSQRSESEPLRNYDVLIYSDLRDWLPPGQGIPPGQPECWEDLPLAAVERLTVRWVRYQEYLETLRAGEKAYEFMRYRLLETMSGGLERLFYGPIPQGRPVRVWWSSDSPEVTELPWELVAYKHPDYKMGNFSFVRGQPPKDLVPPVALEGPLRLALLCDSEHLPVLEPAFRSLAPKVEVEVFPTISLEMLSKAVRGGFEILHLVADGRLSVGYEPLLVLRADDELPYLLTARELAAVFRGGRVAVLGLSAPLHPWDVAPDELVARTPQAYRAFAYLASAPYFLPTTVALLAPLPGEQLADFWHRFYAALADTLSTEQAMARAQAEGRSPVAALFPRSQLGVEFVPAATPSPGGPTAPKLPTVDASVEQVNRELFIGLQQIDEKYQLPRSITKGVIGRQEKKRQKNVQDEMNKWLPPEEVDRG